MLCVDKWEYRIESVKVSGGKFVDLGLGPSLNTLGQQGWELVSVLPTDVDARAMPEYQMMTVHCYLKRRIE